MSLSTSSFRPEWKVIGFVLLALAACELVLRLCSDVISLDLRHIHSIPSISRELAKSSGLNILFMGNSMIRTDLNEAVFLQTETEQLGLGTEVHVARVHLDASHLPEWYYTFKCAFLNRGSVPDVLVLGISGDELADQAEVLTRQLAAFHTDLATIPEVFRYDVPSFSGRVDFVISYLSVAYALRERVSVRVLSSLAPRFEDTEKILHDKAWETKKSAAMHSERTYARLGRLASLADSRGVEVIVVAMPMAPDNMVIVDPDLACRVQELGMTFVDARDIDGIQPDMFVDEMHLNAEGAALFSRALARRLVLPIRRMTVARETSNGMAVLRR